MIRGLLRRRANAIATCAVLRSAIGSATTTAIGAVDYPLIITAAALSSTASSRSSTHTTGDISRPTTEQLHDPHRPVGKADAAADVDAAVDVDVEVDEDETNKNGETVKIVVPRPTPAVALAAASSMTVPPSPSTAPSTPTDEQQLTNAKLITVNDEGNGGGWTRQSDAVYTRPPLEGMRVRAFFENSSSAVVNSMASGRVTANIGGSVFAVKLQAIHFSPVIEVGSRVFVEYGKDEEHQGVVHGGVAVRVNGNGTVGVLLDNNSFDMAVPADMVCLSEGRAKFISDPAYMAVVEWIRSAGVVRRVDQETMACVLYQRGWRVDRLYLLEASDVHCMTFIPKSVRMCALDKSEWQRDHHRQMRQLLKERVKERDFRYRLTKYSGVVSASMAFLGISFAFGWNVKNYRRQQRRFQLSLAVEALTQSRTGNNASVELAALEERHFVPREREEAAVRQVLRQLDVAHPRIVVLTGYLGCGKSTVARAAIVAEDMPAIYVDIRGAEDTLRGVVKAIGVQNIDVCGDLLDFVAEACQKAKAQSGETPLLVLKLREGSNLKRVYNEAVALACDRRLCHLVMEVPMESLTMANTTLPRLDFYTVPNFNTSQAFAYTQRSIDPVSLTQFVEVVGTNSNDLDELFAAVHQRRVSPAEYTNQKLIKAMRLIHGAFVHQPQLRAAVQQLAAFPFEDGQHAGVDANSLSRPALRDVVLYDPVKDTWRFRSKVLHTAARCCD